MTQPDPRALCAAEKYSLDYVQNAVPVQIYQDILKAHLAGWEARDAAGPPESPAAKVGQSICEHGNPEPLTCKKCQEPTSQPSEGGIRRVPGMAPRAFAWRSRRFPFKWIEASFIPPTKATQEADCLEVVDYLCIGEVQTLLAEAKQQGRAVLAQREYESYLGCLRMAEISTKEEFLDYMHRVIKQAKESCPTPSKGD